MQNLRLYILVYLATAFFACGTKVGNPSQNGTPKRTQASINVPYSLPRISFDFAIFFDDSDLLSFFTLNDNGNVKGQSRVQKDVEKLEHLLGETDSFLELFLNQGVTATGTFHGIGPDGQYSVLVSGLEENPSFQYQAVFCSSNTPYMEAYWNAEKTSLKIVRAFKDGENPSKYSDLSAYELHLSMNESPSLEYFFLFDETKNNDDKNNSDAKKDDSGNNGSNRGNGNNRGNIPLNQTIQYEMLSGMIKKQDEKITTIQTIESEDMTSLDAAIEVQEYLVGAVIAGDRSEYIRYRKTDSACNSSFDENAEVPAWCQGGDIKSDSESYSADEAKEAWQRLKEYGLRTKDQLRQPAFSSSSGNCPQAE
ncbi:MAG: hypothetical protein ACOH5I_18045 [Oligoflexus sp.]